jgi:gluconate 2-dehydrogenase gamma chain
LTEAEVVTVDAISECLIPADKDPGARAAGVVQFIDRQLKGKLKRDAAFFRQSIQTLEAACHKTQGKAFAELSLEEQTAILAALEKGAGPREFWPEGDDKRAFEMWLAHTMMGFYGSPRHGGNKDYASWTMVGIPPMPVRGRLHYEWKEQS